MGVFDGVGTSSRLDETSDKPLMKEFEDLSLTGDESVSMFKEQKILYVMTDMNRERYEVVAGFCRG